MPLNVAWPLECSGDILLQDFIIESEDRIESANSRWFIALFSYLDTLALPMFELCLTFSSLAKKQQLLSFEDLQQANKTLCYSFDACLDWRVIKPDIWGAN